VCVVRIRLTLDIYREPKSAADGDNRPVIYDLSDAHIERAEQWDHDGRPPVGFSKGIS